MSISLHYCGDTHSEQGVFLFLFLFLFFLFLLVVAAHMYVRMGHTNRRRNRKSVLGGTSPMHVVMINGMPWLVDREERLVRSLRVNR